MRVVSALKFDVRELRGDVPSRNAEAGHIENRGYTRGRSLGNIVCPTTKAWRTATDRPSLSELVSVYREPIKALACELDTLIKSHPAGDPIVPDEVFFLRYLLSKQSVPKAAEDAKFALEYRRDANNLRRIRKTADRNASWARLNSSYHAERLIPLITGEGFMSRLSVTEYGDLVVYDDIGPGMLDTLDEFNKGDCKMQEHIQKEAFYQYLDAETRKRGYIVKIFQAFDFQNFSWTTQASRNFARFANEMGESSDLSSRIYPQLEAAIIVANSSLLSWLVNMAKPFVNERAFEKVRIVDSLPDKYVDGMRIYMAVGTPMKPPGDLLHWLRQISRYGSYADVWDPGRRIESGPRRSRRSMSSSCTWCFSGCLPCA